jgi:hypothetical protein
MSQIGLWSLAAIRTTLHHIGLYAQSKNRGGRKQPLLAKGSETKFLSGQQPGKHVPAAANTHATTKDCVVYSVRAKGL